MIRYVVTRSAALAALLCVTPLSVVSAEIAKYDEGPFTGPYSESSRVGDLLFLAGQVGEYEDGKLVSGGIGAEAEQIMRNIKATLARRGLGLEHVVKCTVYLVDVREWGAFNEVYKNHFSEPYPARTAVGVSGLVLNARAEMECVAGFP